MVSDIAKVFLVHGAWVSAPGPSSDQRILAMGLDISDRTTRLAVDYEPSLIPADSSDAGRADREYSRSSATQRRNRFKEVI